MYLYAPALEAAAVIVFMVWPRAYPYAIVLRTSTGYQIFRPRVCYSGV